MGKGGHGERARGAGHGELVTGPYWRPWGRRSAGLLQQPVWGCGGASLGCCPNVEGQGGVPVQGFMYCSLRRSRLVLHTGAPVKSLRKHSSPSTGWIDFIFFAFCFFFLQLLQIFSYNFFSLLVVHLSCYHLHIFSFTYVGVQRPT